MFLKVPRAPVSVIEPPAWVAELMDSLPIPRTRTGDDGVFALRGVPPGRTAVAVVSRSRLPLLRPGVRVQPDKPRDLGRIRLKDGEELFGRVIDSSGDPVPGAEVLAAPTSAMLPIEFAGPALRAAADGTFGATGLPRGRITLAARRGPGHRWILAEPQDIAGDVEVVLPDLLDLTLLLTSNAGTPIAAPRCTLLAGRGAGLPAVTALGLTRPIQVAERTEYADGRLRIRGLEPGVYTLRVTDPEHAVKAAVVDLSEDTELALALDARGALRVRAVDAAGESVAGAHVYAIAQPTPEWPAALPVPCGVTDSSGHVDLDRISGRVVEVVASHPALGRTRGVARRDQPTNTITFGEIGAIEGVLHENSRPVESRAWSVLLLPEGESAVPELPLISQLDREGRFRFGALQPGKYRVRAIESLDMLVTPGAVMELGKNSWMPSPRIADIEVRGGHTAQVRVDVGDPPPAADAPGARVTGNVLIDGEPGAGMVVMVDLDKDKPPLTTKVGRDGRFVLPHVPAGKRFFFAFDTVQHSMADNWPHMMWSGWVEVVANVDGDVIIEVRTATLAGEVIDPEGEPAAGAWVEAAGELATPGRPGAGAVRTRYVVKANRNGRFEVPGIPPGKWAVGNRSVGSKEVKGMLRDIAVEAGQLRDDLRIQLSR